MLSYIAGNSISDLIKNICKELNIIILNQEIEEVDFLKYIKQTKVNFNLIKYLIIDLDKIKNTNEEIINGIIHFNELYRNARIIVIARGYDSQNEILNKLYENKIYNIINSNDEIEIKSYIKKCLSKEGLQEKDAKRFKRIEKEKVDKKREYKKFIFKLREKLKTVNNHIKQKEEKAHTQTNSVYFFAILVDAITGLVRLLCYCVIFLLTSLGLTFLFNEELRNIIFQIFNN